MSPRNRGPSVSVKQRSYTRVESYTNARPDIVRLVGMDRERILDVGCSTGAMGAAIKRRQAAVVDGIEYDPNAAAMARQSLDAIAVGNLDDWAGIATQLGDDRYDCIICADVLEHLRDPWDALSNLLGLLDDGGQVVISLPNAGHLSMLWNVFIRRRFPRRERGLHDETHLRWFARRDVEDLVEAASLKVIELRRSYRVFDAPTRKNELARFLAVPGLRDLLTYQFYLVAEKPPPRQ